MFLDVLPDNRLHLIIVQRLAKLRAGREAEIALPIPGLVHDRQRPGVVVAKVNG
jgi:hypothetical protein